MTRPALAAQFCPPVAAIPCYKEPTQARSWPYTGALTGAPEPSLEGLSLEESVKSIAIPVTRKRAAAVKVKEAKNRPAGHPVANHDMVVGGSVGPLRRKVGPVIAAPKHRYRIGERVRMNGGGRSLARSEAACKVMALLPHEGGPLLYRVRSEVESYERVVQEADLDPIR